MDQIVVAWVYINIRLYDCETGVGWVEYGIFKVANERESMCMIIIDLVAWPNVCIMI